MIFRELDDVWEDSDVWFYFFSMLIYLLLDRSVIKMGCI